MTKILHQGPDENQANKSVQRWTTVQVQMHFFRRLQVGFGDGWCGVTGYFGMNGMRLEWNVPHHAFLKHELHCALHLAKPKKHQSFGIDYG